MKGIYRLADLNILIEFLYPCTEKFLREYKAVDNQDVSVDFSITVDKAKLEKECLENGIKRIGYYENLYILREISKKLVEDYNGFMFHASSIAVDGKAYCFTAKSGTGKSTHARFLSKVLGNRFSYINDDKPFIRYLEKEDKFYVYGNAWNGKHKLGENKSYPLGAISYLVRGKENAVDMISSSKALALLLEQITYPEDQNQAQKLIKTLNKLFEKTPMYLLKCVNDVSSATVSYKNVIEKNL